MKFPQSFKKSKGFTLLELLIVIAIIGILATVVLVVLNPLTQFKKSRDTQRRNDMKVLQVALEDYHSDHGVYPSTGGFYYSSDPNDNSCCLAPTSTDGVGNYIPGLVSGGYIKQLPADPLGGTSSDPQWKRAYLYRSNGSEYALLAHHSIEITPMSNSQDYFYDARRPSYAWKICVGASACPNASCSGSGDPNCGW